MGAQKIQDLLAFEIPSDMREMTAGECASFFPAAHEESFGIRNEEKHTVMAVGCKKKPFLVGRLASLEDTLKTTERNIKKNVPSYENVGYGSVTADGKEIPTFECRYTAEGKPHRAKYGLYSSGNYLLAFTYICGEDCADFAEQKFEELLSSVRFK